MGSRYFGRAIKKWRLFAHLSQEELAERAEVSVAIVGGCERERGHISEESFAKLCVGLESKLGRPMLATVFSEGLQALWEELLSNERRLRQARGWKVADYETSGPSLEDLDRAFDSALVEVKKCALLWYRALDRRTKSWEGWESPSRQSDDPRQESGRGAARVRVRKRRP